MPGTGAGRVGGRAFAQVEFGVLKMDSIKLLSSGLSSRLLTYQNNVKMEAVGFPPKHW